MAGKSKTKKTKAAKKTNGAEAASNIGHNSSSGIPGKTETKAFFARLDRLHEEMGTARANFMLDIKSVYSEAAGKFGVTRKVFRKLYSRYQAEIAFETWQAELESKEQHDADRMLAACAAAFGDTPMGRYCKAVGEARSAESRTVEVGDAPVVDETGAAAE